MSSTAFYRHAYNITHAGKLEITELLTVTGIVPGLLLLFGLGFNVLPVTSRLKKKFSKKIFVCRVLSSSVEYLS